MNKESSLREIFNSFLRNKYYISAFTLLGLVFGIVTSLSLKRMWQGDFQIVLQKEGQESSLNFDSPLARAVNLGRFKDDDLKTEIAILESPFVLKEIFEFVKTEKSKIGKKNYEKIRFKQWKSKNLNIGLKKRTKVLEIFYKDNDKEIIIPVLEKISMKYQSYAEEKRLKSINLGLDFFQSQLEKYKEKSLNSLIEAQRYAISQDLTILDGNSAMDEEIPNFIDVEAIRIESSNRIKRIDLRLDQINNLKENDENVIYIVDTIPSLKESDLSVNLKEIDKEISRLKVIYSENDDNVKDLIKEKSFLIKLLKKQVLGYLEAERISEEAKFKAAERPEGVLIKYKTLLRNAKKDEKVLSNLENEYRGLLLQKAESSEPWELITKPNLDPTPISPNRKEIALFGLIGGFVFGLLFSFYRESNKDLIYSSDELIFLTELPLINEIISFKNSKINQDFDYNFAKIKLEKFDKICFLILGNLNSLLYNSVDNYLKNFSSKNQILITKNLNDTIINENIILVVPLGKTTKSEIVNLNNKLLSLNKNVIGLISIQVSEGYKSI